MESNNKAKAEISLFYTHIIILIILVCVSLINMTMNWGSQNMWMAVLTGALGAIIPSPQLNVKDGIIN